MINPIEPFIEPTIEQLKEDERERFGQYLTPIEPDKPHQANG